MFCRIAAIVVLSLALPAIGQDKKPGDAPGELFFTGKGQTPLALERIYPGITAALNLTDEQKTALREAMERTIHDPALREAGQKLKSDPAAATEADRASVFEGARAGAGAVEGGGGQDAECGAEGVDHQDSGGVRGIAEGGDGDIAGGVWGGQGERGSDQPASAADAAGIAGGDGGAAGQDSGCRAEEGGGCCGDDSAGPGGRRGQVERGEIGEDMNGGDMNHEGHEGCEEDCRMKGQVYRHSRDTERTRGDGTMGSREWPVFRRSAAGRRSGGRRGMAVLSHDLRRGLYSYAAPRLGCIVHQSKMRVVMGHFAFFAFFVGNLSV